MSRKVLRAVISVISAITLAITFLACGFAVCAGIPQATETLCRTYGNENISPFTTDELAQAALATRDYSFGSHNLDDLMETVAAINDEAETPWANASMNQLKNADEAYVLTPDAISHLDDVYDIVVRVVYVLIACAVIAVLTLFLLGRIWGARSLGVVLIGSGAVICGLLVLLGVWALISFNSLFAVFHSLFFASGTWTFSANSLLICMFPEDFWIAMAAIWLVVSVLLSILSIVIGALLRRRRTSKKTRQEVQANATA